MFVGGVVERSLSAMHERLDGRLAEAFGSQTQQEEPHLYVLRYRRPPVM